MLIERIDSVRRIQIAAALALLGAVGLPVVARAQQEGPLPTTATITIESKHGEQLNPSMLNLQVNRHPAVINSVTPIDKAAPQVAILIDDGLRASFGNQIEDIKAFLNALPGGTKVAVGYMQNGSIRMATDGFVTDRSSAANALRITVSTPGISASPYFCLSDFVKKWPSDQPGARIVLMLTNGVDPYNGRPSIENQDSPYVQEAQEDAQRAGVAVYSIYYADSGFAFRGGRGSFSGQSYLQQVGDATGGQSFNLGTITPPSIRPYLDQFTKALAESYVVSFQADTAKEKTDTLDSLKLTTTQPGVKIHAPQAVHPGTTVIQ
jgi:hypothetical protein